MINIIRQREDNPISIRELSRKLRLSQKEILQMCEDQDLCINVAVGVGGWGYASIVLLEIIL